MPCCREGGGALLSGEGRGGTSRASRASDSLLRLRAVKAAASQPPKGSSACARCSGSCRGVMPSSGGSRDKARDCTRVEEKKGGGGYGGYGGVMAVVARPKAGETKKRGR